MAATRWVRKCREKVKALAAACNYRPNPFRKIQLKVVPMLLKIRESSEKR